MGMTTIEYVRRKKDGPFTIGWVTNNGSYYTWWIIDCADSLAFPASLRGNSKQRRQQRRKMLKELNQ